jgi:hypothetical protein
LTVKRRNVSPAPSFSSPTSTTVPPNDIVAAIARDADMPHAASKVTNPISVRLNRDDSPIGPEDRGYLTWNQGVRVSRLDVFVLSLRLTIPDVLSDQWHCCIRIMRAC